MGILSWFFGLFAKDNYDTKNALKYVKHHPNEFKIPVALRKHYERVFTQLTREQITTNSRLLTEKEIKVISNRTLIRLYNKELPLKDMQAHLTLLKQLEKRLSEQYTQLGIALKLKNETNIRKRLKEIQTRINKEVSTYSGFIKGKQITLGTHELTDRAIKGVVSEVILKWREISNQINLVLKEKIRIEEFQAYIRTHMAQTTALARKKEFVKGIATVEREMREVQLRRKVA